LDAGLDAVNLSLDTLDGGKFFSITRRPMFGAVMEALTRLAEEERLTVKVNCVPIMGVNDEELAALAALARAHPIDVRFIELMPIGCARTEGYRGVPMDEVRAHLKEAFGALLPVGEATHGNAVPVGPAAYVRPAGFAGTLGFIDAMEHKFCDTCNRVRLTAEGFLKLCLYSNAGLDTRALLRGGVTDAQLRERIAHAVWKKPAEHYFEMDSETRDQRAMYQVGG
ncbi:MAG: GTP 3',8-cyclase MoaA, partial [Selenomonas sp.]|nr:GTP 3',8-cyclase MoaA [Selenomonas sp.]